MEQRSGSKDEPTRRATRNIIVVGGSAGALDAFLALAASLPADFGGSVFIVSHVGANRSQLPELLSTAGKLPAAHAKNGEPIAPGRIRVAPPDRHMLIADGHIRLTRGAREHFTRPAIDPLFRSAARAFGPAVIGVVLSGTGSDGAFGLERIRRAGGIAVVQDPCDALFPEMPQVAAATVPVHHIVGSAALGALLTRLVNEPIRATPPSEGDTDADMEEFERPSALTCPDCGGALRELPEAPLKMYRCHTGHSFGAKELLDQQVEDIDRAVIVAVRVLNEHAELCRRMAAEAGRCGRTHGMAYWARLRREADEQLAVLREFLARERHEEPEPAAATAEE